eukprot:NODE_29_length_33183_cov_0.333666.p26 type:complete len:105 gc:universal NODE_29_length_33183_cov_0.333666:19606-19920(+)
MLLEYSYLEFSSLKIGSSSNLFAFLVDLRILRLNFSKAQLINDPISLSKEYPIISGLVCMNVIATNPKSDNMALRKFISQVSLRFGLGDSSLKVLIYEKNWKYW